MAITAFYAAILGLWLVTLSARVIVFRRSEKVSLGHGGHATLERRMRAQGNLTEYAPLALILIGTLELADFSDLVIHLLGILLVVGRLLHGWALSFTPGNSIGRTGGMVLTLTVIGAAAVLNIAKFLG